MKTKFTSRLFLLTVAIITLNSCRNNELLNEQEKYNKSSQFKPTSKKIRLEQSKHKLALKNELQKTQANLQKIKTNLFVKSVDYSSDVFIDTDNVTYIEYGANYYSYTFNLIRENAPESTIVENLVLSPLANGTYKELLVTYNITQQEKLYILSGKSVNTKGKTAITELTNGTYRGVDRVS
ncbi:hypothetical protein [Chryseobacterium hispalense]|uniref:hypothetical protein n=1 Tax=Chryseobacterium hispalense TaxID=1453492 RepID=UPI00391AF422